ncbi:MAG: LCP family protein [Propioniciclava sp.]|uniref:LCP family protein n=1 Tax=Propioniciclava sp. TaxID=2038686 RepID=UPI0039E55252
MTMDERPDGVRRRSERLAFRRGLSLLALTVLVPGSAQVIAGGRGLGQMAIKVWLGVWAVVLGFVALTLLRRDWALTVYAHPVTQWTASVLVLVLGLGWTWLFLDAWRLSRPRSMGRRRYAMALLSTLLAFAVGVGSLSASAASRSQAELFGTVFAGGGDGRAVDGRINVLLLGADAEVDRPGIRTDTMMVASVDTVTGRTVLFSLPRNLQWAPFPASSPLRRIYPRGFWCPDQSCLLNAVHTETANHSELFEGVADPGVNELRGVVAEILGLKINYYAMVDMRGFESLVDALGGVRLDIAKAVPIGGGSSKVEGYIQPGKGVLLDGFRALWFARSRHGASDYERMARQKCVVNALAKQVTPVNVVTRFNELADAGTAMVRTDIPGSDLMRLAELADAGRRLPIASTSFAPPLIEPVKPDFGLIRATVKADIAASEALDRAAEGSSVPTPEPSAAPAPMRSAQPAKRGEGPTAKPVVSGKAGRAVGEFSEERQTGDLAEICGVS